MKIFRGREGRLFLEWVLERMPIPVSTGDQLVEINLLNEILELGEHRLTAKQAQAREEKNIIDEVLE